MATDWAAISALGVGATAFAGTWYQSRRGAATADRDNRFDALNETVDQLRKENQRYRDEIAADELRHRQSDTRLIETEDELIRVRRRAREAIDALADAQLEISDRDRTIARERAEWAVERARLIALAGGQSTP